MVESLVGNVPLLLLVAGLVLMVLEALSPGAHLIVIGIALVGAGLVGVLFPPAASPIILAGLTLVIGLAAAYVYREFDFYGGKGTAQTTDSDSLAGTTGYVTEAVTNRSGEVKLEQGGFAPYYSARTTNGTIEEGEEIIVLDPGGGNVLTVESLDSIGEDEIDRALARERAASESREREAADGGDELDDAGSEADPEPETEKSS
ncbi:NfeD family protein [Natrinema caseinilyticum]|uniref:NfeD family protein n=1 Tax=Natrinema caseinilyticum TaxID=2961570 RepID=UPI0020C57E33|nr:NfeD family protein [Natrinema caseinilyticum]